MSVLAADIPEQTEHYCRLPDRSVTTRTLQNFGEDACDLQTFMGITWFHFTKECIQQQRPDSPVASGVSMQSDEPNAGLIDFKGRHISLERRLSGCNLTERSCEALATVLISQYSSVRELNLSSNDLQDSGVTLLSAGLASAYCKLESLRLSGCQITKEGHAALVAALITNPSHLKELDLSDNHPGDSGAELLSAVLKDPGLKPATFRVVPPTSGIGQNDKSWSLLQCDNKYSACHNNRRVVITVPSFFDSSRVAVYLNWPAGSLIHLHTFNTTFTEPLYPAFGFELKFEPSVSLCRL